MTPLTRLFICFSLALLVAGCSSLYHPQEGWVPEGYTDQRLSEDEYLISFQTYRKEPWTVHKHNLVYRAAEVGKAHGFRYFSIADLKRHENLELESAQETIRSHVIPAAGGGTTKSQALHAPGAQVTREWTIRILEGRVVYSNDSGEFRVDAVLEQGPRDG